MTLVKIAMLVCIGVFIGGYWIHWAIMKWNK